MSVSLSTAMSGISAAQERLRASAHNVANLETQGAKPVQVDMSTQPEGGVRAQQRQSEQVGISAERELVEQRAATYTFVANLRVLQTQLRAEGTLLDIQA